MELALQICNEVRLSRSLRFSRRELHLTVMTCAAPAVSTVECKACPIADLFHPVASDLGSIAVGSPLDTVVGGSLEDVSPRSDFIVPLAHALGNCQNQVPYSSAISTYHRHDSKDWNLRPRTKAQVRPTWTIGRKRPPVPEVRSPTLRRRELGDLLRSRRLELGLTVELVAERLLSSDSKMSRMEMGARGATQRDVRDLCDPYGMSSGGSANGSWPSPERADSRDGGSRTTLLTSSSPSSATSRRRSS